MNKIWPTSLRSQNWCMYSVMFLHVINSGVKCRWMDWALTGNAPSVSCHISNSPNQNVTIMFECFTNFRLARSVWRGVVSDAQDVSHTRPGQLNEPYCFLFLLLINLFKLLSGAWIKCFQFLECITFNLILQLNRFCVVVRDFSAKIRRPICLRNCHRSRWGLDVPLENDQDDGDVVSWILVYNRFAYDIPHHLLWILLRRRLLPEPCFPQQNDETILLDGSTDNAKSRKHFLSFDETTYFCRT